MNNLTIAILAGGSSNRMGLDKASIVIHSETLLERTARIGLSAHDSVVVVGRTKPEEWNFDSVEFIPDRYPGLGPLGGLVTALYHLGTHVLLLACDMPKMSKEALGWLIEYSQNNPYQDGVISQHGEQLEPLCSLYARSCFDAATECLERSEYRMHRFIAEGRFSYVRVPTEHIVAFHNVNYPQDLE